MADNQSSERFVRLPDGTTSRASETTEVFMAGSGQGPSDWTVEIQPGQRHTIATNSLTGCSSVALIGRDAEGRSLLHMNHFPPLLENMQKMQLESESPRFASLDQANTKVSVLVAVPGDWQENSEGRYEMAPKNPTQVEALTNAALSGFGDRSAVEVSVLPYSERRQHGHHNGFIIEVPSTSHEPIRYDLHASTYGSIEASRTPVEVNRTTQITASENRSANSAANPERQALTDAERPRSRSAHGL